MRALWMICAFLVSLAGPALAQPAPPAAVDPAALVRSFYVPGYIEHEQMPLTPRLARLLQAAMANSKKINGPVNGIDFSWTLNGQDSEEGTLASVRIGEPKMQGQKAQIRVTFRNGGPMELQYDLVQTGGKWLVDDIQSIRKPRWTLSKLLDMGAKQKD